MKKEKNIVFKKEDPSKSRYIMGFKSRENNRNYNPIKYIRKQLRKIYTDALETRTSNTIITIKQHNALGYMYLILASVCFISAIILSCLIINTDSNNLFIILYCLIYGTGGLIFTQIGRGTLGWERKKKKNNI